MSNVTGIRRRLDSITRYVDMMRDGLNGHRHALYKGETIAFRQFARRFGFELLSKTAAKKRGLELRRAAKPVVACWFGSPINDFHDLYLIEQFRNADKKEGV